MIDTYDSKRGLVIPKWLDFSKASKGEELWIPRKDTFKINSTTKRQFEEEYLDFKNNPSPHKASDLMGSAIVIGDATLAKELARYVKNCPSLKKPTLDLADKILNPDNQNPLNPELEIRIAESKSLLSDFPKNAIGWIEMARFYTIKGQLRKARKAVLVALNLAPFDRYIVRCGVRFFLHIEELDSAWHYIRKASQFSTDPWLKATETSVSVIVKKGIGNVKRFIPKNISVNQIFHFAELIESYGMLELISGNNGKAKKNFKLAWSNPSENVVTHGEWILRNRLPGLTESTSLNFAKSLEALAWRHYYNLELREALITVKAWELEEPYSTNPFQLGSSIACDAGDPDEAAKFALRGLTANPRDFLLNNNLCFALLSPPLPLHNV